MAPKKKLTYVQPATRNDNELEIIESDPSRMRINSDDEQTDPLRLFADGEPPSPESPINNMPSEEASY